MGNLDRHAKHVQKCSRRPRQPSSLAEVVCDLGTPKLRKELENFRIQYERAHGPTDLTRRYTSTLPVPVQDWLLDNHPQRYWDGLPPFAQEFLRNKLLGAAQDGSLDDMPEAFVKLFVNRHIGKGDAGQEH